MPGDNRPPEDETPVPAATWKPALGKDARKDDPNRAAKDEPVNPEQTGVAQPRQDASVKEKRS